MTRFAPLQLNDMSSEQKRVYDAIINGPRGKVAGPLEMWLRVPEFAERAQALGAYCRFDTSLGPRLTELAILVVSGFWQAEFEWKAHEPLASAAGISQAVIDAIKKGENPDFSEADELAVWRFSSELLTNRKVSLSAWEDAASSVALEGIVELIGVLGYFSLIALTINVFEI